MTFASEKELAGRVVAWLNKGGWDVYQEVKVFADGATADIVAKCGRKLWVIETKRSYGLAVIEQALRWKAYAHCVSVAVPQRRGVDKPRHVASMVHRYAGIGLLYVGYDVNVSHPADFVGRPHMLEYLAGSLREEHKHYAKAGTASGGAFTPFQATKKAVIALLSTTPGLTMTEIIRTLGRMHYASDVSAKCSLAKWIQMGKIPEISMTTEKRYYLTQPGIRDTNDESGTTSGSA